MHRLLPAVGLLLFLAGSAGGQEEEGPPSLESLTRQAASLQRKIRRERNPADRKELLEALELLYHQMGPTDAAGKRVRCQAMWHDQALEQLGGEMKRLSGRKVPLAEARGGTLVRLGRLAVRRMAQACLVHGWRIYAGPEKYQVNAFGQYLANNLPTLDGLLKRLSGLSVPAGGAEAGQAEAEQAEAAPAIAKARAGLAKMIEAADAMVDTPSDQPDGLIVPLGTFMEGLTAVREAVEGVRAAEAEAAEEAQPAGPASSPPPPMTEAEKQRIASLRQVAAALTEADWDAVADYVERFASMIEVGFTVAGARPKARELLEQTERAVELARSLASTQVLEEERLAGRRRGLLRSLAEMARPADRADGYARLERQWSHDAFRRRLETLDLSAEAARGLLRAREQVAPTWKQSELSEVVDDGRAMASACSSLGKTLGSMQNWPPKDMDDQFLECYGHQKKWFLEQLESAGRRVLEDAGKALGPLQVAARRGQDLALIVRAERVVKAVKRYRPRQAGRMYQQMLHPAKGLVVDPNSAERSRGQLEDFVRPFEDLEAFPAPEPAHRRMLSGLLGQVYPAAVAKLTRDLAVGIDSAATGDPMPLREALQAADLFGLARKRALAEEAGLQRAGVRNLAAFSMPAGLWTNFHQGLDRWLQAMFTAYVRGRKTSLWRTEPAALEAVYGPVVAAQRLTLEARFPGEADLGFLMRNLQRVTVLDPPDRAGDAWRVGYHATEAAATTVADLDTVAAWHRRRMRYNREHLDRVELSAPAEPPS